MRKRKIQVKNQLSLVIEPVKRTLPVEDRLEGLVEALADLLLEALDAAGSATKGGVDEQQDHA
jgi:antitoxin component of MazEF toxin-antitoxin module